MRKYLWEVNIVFMKDNRIKDLREDNDLLQKDVAKELNISQVQYSRYETGIRVMPINLLIKLAKFYDVSLEYLTGISNIKKSYPKDKVNI